jgi:hypothetical protein
VPGCDLEASTLRRPGQTIGCHATGGNHIFSRICRISHLMPSLLEVAKAGFYFARQSDKTDSAKPSLTDPQELYQ